MDVDGDPVPDGWIFHSSVDVRRKNHAVGAFVVCAMTVTGTGRRGGTAQAAAVRALRTRLRRARLPMLQVLVGGVPCHVTLGLGRSGEGGTPPRTPRTVMTAPHHTTPARKTSSNSEGKR